MHKTIQRWYSHWNYAVSNHFCDDEMKSRVERAKTLVWMARGYVALQWKHSGGTIRTKRTGVRLLAGVCSNVRFKISLPRATVWAMWASKWLLSCVNTYVPFETGQNMGGIFTVGTLVHLDVTRAGPGLLGSCCSSPVFASVQPHLQRCPAYFRLQEFIKYHTAPFLLSNTAH